jgi:hypothetical protein
MEREIGTVLSLQNIIQKTTSWVETKLLTSELCNSVAEGVSFNELNSQIHIKRKLSFVLFFWELQAKVPKQWFCASEKFI